MGNKPTIAETLGGKILGTPSLFSEAIRSLMVDYGNGDFKYSPRSQFLAVRLLRAPSVQVPLYYATFTFLREKLDGAESLNPEEILQFYKPSELAVLFTNLFLYRRAKKACPADEWTFINEMFMEQMEIGGYFGYAIPDVGPAFGLIAGGLRPLSLVAFAVKDIESFKKYRRSLKNKKQLFDIAYEESLFGCSHVDLCCFFLQQLGFGTSMATGFYEAMTDSVLSEDEISGQFARFAAARHWIEALTLTSGMPQDEVGSDDLDEKAISKLITQVTEIKNSGSLICWPEKKPSDFPHQENLLKIPEKKSARPKKNAATTIIETDEEFGLQDAAQAIAELAQDTTKTEEEEIPEEIAREFGLIK